MSDAGATPFRPDGTPSAAFAALLLLGRERGYLTPDDLMAVLETVELSATLIDAVIDRVRAEGIDWRDDTEESEGDDEATGDEALRGSGLGLGPGDSAETTNEAPSGHPPETPAVRTAPANLGDTSEALARMAGRVRTRTGSRLSVADLRVDLEGTSGPTSDPVRMYLKEIGKVPLLTAEEEVILARCVEAGLDAGARILERQARAAGSGDWAGGKASRAARNPAAEADQETPRDERLRAEGQAAKRILVEANLRLVVSIARRYRNRGMAFLDLTQEGNLGLMRAVDKFDYTRGFKFSTYATWWIRQAITRAIADQARTIRIPVHMVETINKVVRIQRQLLQELGREPIVEEVAERAELSSARVREILRVSLDTVSLEQPMGEDDFSLSDLIEDEAAVAPQDAAARTMLNRAVNDVLGELNEREQRVVRLRFGLDDGHVRTLEEVGREFGVTRERVRQIESKTLAKLRQPMRSAHLRDYLDES